LNFSAAEALLKGTSVLAAIAVTAVPNNNFDQNFIEFLPLPEARHRSLAAVLLLDCPLSPTANQEDCEGWFNYFDHKSKISYLARS
jgi:hypothetical protein